MVFFQSSLLTGVEASAAQNAPVTKTCLQCGAILPSSVRVCNFCDSSVSSIDASPQERGASSPAEARAPIAHSARHYAEPALEPEIVVREAEQSANWQGELN